MALSRARIRLARAAGLIKEEEESVHEQRQQESQFGMTENGEESRAATQKGEKVLKYLEGLAGIDETKAEDGSGSDSDGSSGSNGGAGAGAGANEVKAYVPAAFQPPPRINGIDPAFVRGYHLPWPQQTTTDISQFGLGGSFLFSKENLKTVEHRLSEGHEWHINASTIAGNYLFTGGDDCDLLAWDLTSLVVTHEFGPPLWAAARKEGHTSPIVLLSSSYSDTVSPMQTSDLLRLARSFYLHKLKAGKITGLASGLSGDKADTWKKEGLLAEPNHHTIIGQRLHNPVLGVGEGPPALGFSWENSNSGLTQQDEEDDGWSSKGLDLGLRPQKLNASTGFSTRLKFGSGFMSRPRNFRPDMAWELRSPGLSNRPRLDISATSQRFRDLQERRWNRYAPSPRKKPPTEDEEMKKGFSSRVKGVASSASALLKKAKGCSCRRKRRASVVSEASTPRLFDDSYQTLNADNMAQVDLEAGGGGTDAENEAEEKRVEDSKHNATPHQIVVISVSSDGFMIGWDAQVRMWKRWPVRTSNDCFLFPQKQQRLWNRQTPSGAQVKDIRFIEQSLVAWVLLDIGVMWQIDGWVSTAGAGPHHPGASQPLGVECCYRPAKH